MMKNKKWVLALAGSALFSILPMAAFAEDEENEETEKVPTMAAWVDPIRENAKWLDVNIRNFDPKSPKLLATGKRLPS